MLMIEFYIIYWVNNMPHDFFMMQKVNYKNLSNEYFFQFKRFVKKFQLSINYY